MIVIIIFDGRVKEALDVKLSKTGEPETALDRSDQSGQVRDPNLSLPPTPPTPPSLFLFNGCLSILSLDSLCKKGRNREMCRFEELRCRTPGRSHVLQGARFLFSLLSLPFLTLSNRAMKSPS